MLGRTTLKRHAGLVDKMANRQAIDLEEEMFRGRVSVGDIEEAVLRCTGCSCPNACESMLTAEAGQTGPRPDYCRNHDLFARLMPAK